MMISLNKSVLALRLPCAKSSLAKRDLKWEYGSSSTDALNQFCSRSAYTVERTQEVHQLQFSVHVSGIFGNDTPQFVDSVIGTLLPEVEPYQLSPKSSFLWVERNKSFQEGFNLREVTLALKNINFQKNDTE